MSINPYRPDPEKVARAAEKAKTRAEQYVRDPEKSKDLLDRAYKKTGAYEKSNGALPDFWRDIKTLMRMLRAYTRKEYKRIAWGSLLSVVGGIIYFVSPIDLIPDWFPLAGFVDDAAILVFLMAQLRGDLAKFAVWEEERNEKPPSLDIIDI
jgi:uncharacterized membrane protein YkvA (DUF1232 family)